MSELLNIFLIGVLGGVIGFSLAALLKIQRHMYTYKVRRNLDDMDDAISDFKGRMNIKYNALARTVTKALDIDVDEQLADIPPEVQALAKGAGLDLNLLLTGDAQEIEKIKKLLGSKGKTGDLDVGL